MHRLVYRPQRSPGNSETVASAPKETGLQTLEQLARSRERLGLPETIIADRTPFFVVTSQPEMQSSPRLHFFRFSMAGFVSIFRI